MPAAQPTHRIVQLSDLHLTQGNAPLHGAIDPEAQLRAAFDRLNAADLPLDAVIMSGDLADNGHREVYQRLAGWVERFGASLGCPILLGLGNHDAREPFHEFVAGAELLPADSVAEVNGLRIIQLDSSVPGAGHGHLDAEQLDWLAQVLQTPAPHGSLLVVHHPPAPASSEVMAMVELTNPADLVPVLSGSDVRLILSGHMHHSGSSSLAGIPISIASSVGYASDPAFDHLGYRGLLTGQAFNLIEVFEHQIVTKVVPLEPLQTLYQLTAEELAALLAKG